MFNAGIPHQKISEILQIDIEQVDQVLSALV
jgi:hypothetical protein